MGEDYRISYGLSRKKRCTISCYITACWAIKNGGLCPPSCLAVPVSCRPPLPVGPPGIVTFNSFPMTGLCGLRKAGGSPRETARITSTSPFVSPVHPRFRRVRTGPLPGPRSGVLPALFIDRTAGANLEGDGPCAIPGDAGETGDYLVASMNRSGGTLRTANPILTEGNSSRTGTRRCPGGW